MRAIILGANGKLGRILHHYARQTGQNWVGQARKADCDIRWSGDVDAADAKSIFRQGATLINMIGDTSGDPQTMNHMNVEFVKTLLERSTEAGVAHVVLASSAAVYGGKNDGDWQESDDLKPQTPYGASKAAMEDIAQTFSANNDGPAITILRIGNVAGADALTKAAQAHVAKNQPMPVHRFADRSAPIRSYVSPLDLFRCCRDLTAKPLGPLRIFNIAHPTPVALDAVVSAYQQHVFPNLTWANTPAPANTPPRVVLSTDRLQAHVNFMTDADPAQTLARGVADYLAERGMT